MTVNSMTDWQPIETAPKDEAVPILVWFDHDADPYQDPDNPGHLTDYAAVAEGGDFLSGNGIAMAVWRDGYHDSDGWESACSYWVPGGWFAYVNGDATDYIANAINWQPLPAPPAQGTSGSAQGAQRLEPKGAGPVGKADAPETPIKDHNHDQR